MRGIRLSRVMLLGVFSTMTLLGINDVHTTCLSKPGITYKIAKMEGYYVPGSLPRRINNPGSIVFAHQRGARRHSSGFAQFATVELGWEALARDVEGKVRRGIPLRKAWKYLK